MSGSLSVSLRRKGDALILKLCAQCGEVLDNAVVNDGDAPVEGKVRVGVLIGRGTVGGPPGVTDTLVGLRERMSGQFLLEVSQLA